MEPASAENILAEASDADPNAATAGTGGIHPWCRRRRLVAGLAAATVLLVAGGVWWWRHARRFESTDDAFIDTHFVRISTRVAGRVLEVPVTDNQSVPQGQVMVLLDPTDFRVAVDQARAGLAEAEGRQAQAAAQEQVGTATVAEEEALAEVAAANAANALADLRRYQALARSAPAAVSRQQYDNALAAQRTTAAQVNSAAKRVTAAQAQLAAAQAQAATAAAQVQSARARLDQARLNLDYTRVTAPQGGHVSRLTVAVGAWVQPGEDLMALVPRRVWVTANFKETQLDRMRPGQKVSIRIDAYPNLRLDGHVDSIQRGSGPAFSLLPPENATGNWVKVVQRVPVKIVIDTPIPPDHPVGPGLSVEPTVRVR